MTRGLALTLAAAAASVCLAVVFDVRKLLVVQSMQLTAAPPVVAATEPPPTHPFLVAFDDASSSEELFAPEGALGVVGVSDLADGVWERLDRHQLVIRVQPDLPLHVSSHGTRLWHKHRRVTNMYFYPFEGLQGYRQSVASSERLFRDLGIAEKVVWSEFERRLDDRPTDAFVPVIEFASATLSLSLACLGWDDALPARAQVERVSCHPVITIGARS
jgi:hypothetical protein